jgi:hypothetical protein
LKILPKSYKVKKHSKIEKAKTYLEGFLGERLMKAFLPWTAAKNRNKRMMTTRTIKEHRTYSSKESQKLSVTLLDRIATEFHSKIQLHIKRKFQENNT